jgi:hypothetical protein
VVRLLAAAAAPATPQELAGEQRVVATFVAAARAHPHPHSLEGAMPSKLTRVKAAVALLAAAPSIRVLFRDYLKWTAEPQASYGSWPPFGGVDRPRRVVRFARLIHAARPRSWRALGPRRLRRHLGLTVGWLPRGGWLA